MANYRRSETGDLHSESGRAMSPCLRALAVVVALVAGGCGSRISHEQHLATNVRSGGSAPSEDARPVEADTAATPSASEQTPVAQDDSNGFGTDAAASAAVTPTSPAASTSRAATQKPPTSEAATGAPKGAAPVRAGASKGPSPTGTGASKEVAPTPAAPAGNAGTTATCTGRSPIIIGQVGNNSGIGGQAVRPSIDAVRAWVAATNAKGGVNCHPVRYLVADDGGDPSRRQSLVAKLVETDKVIAFVEMGDILSGSAEAAKYFEQKRIPVIDWGHADWAFENTMYFPSGASGRNVALISMPAAARVAKETGATKIAGVYCIEAPICSAAYPLGPQQARDFGMTMVYQAKASLTQPDYTSVCQAAQNAGAQQIIIYLEGNGVARFARSCRSVNYRPQIVAVSLALVKKAADDPNVDGTLYSMANMPWFATDIPAVAEFTAVMKRYAPGAELNPSAMTGWVGAKLFEAAARDVSEPPTNESLLEGFWKIKNFDAGGLTMPLTFTKGAPPPDYWCFWTTQVKDGKFIAPTGTARQCKPSS